MIKLKGVIWSPIRENENIAQTIVRVLGNLARWIVVITAIVFSGQSIQNWMGERPYLLSSLAGIEIGMTTTEVKLRRGAPEKTFIRETKPDGYADAWFYDDVLVLFKTNHIDEMRVWRVCDTSPSPYSEVIGVSNGDAEEQVLKHLGLPNAEIISESELSKASHFSRFNFIIYFEKAKVDSFCVGGVKETSAVVGNEKVITNTGGDDPLNVSSLPQGFVLDTHTRESSVAKYRLKHPEYSHLREQELLELIRKKYHHDMPPEGFWSRVGFEPTWETSATYPEFDPTKPFEIVPPADVDN